MAESPSVRDRARTGLLALDLLEAAATAGAVESAAALAREMAPVALEGLSEANRESVAAVLAVMAVWMVPGAPGCERSPDERRRRVEALRAWVRGQRLEWSVLAS